jgi:transketolase
VGGRHIGPFRDRRPDESSANVAAKICNRQDRLRERRSGEERKCACRCCPTRAATLGWARYVGRHGAIVGMHTFGASAPLKGLLTKFGFTPENVVTVAREQIAKHGG